MLSQASIVCDGAADGRLLIAENAGHAELSRPIASAGVSFLACTIGGIQGEEDDSLVLVGSLIVTADTLAGAVACHGDCALRVLRRSSSGDSQPKTRAG